MKDNLIQFPCDFTLKIMGIASNEFEQTIVCIVHKHFPNLGEGAIKMNESSRGNYISLSVTVLAQNQKQLDDLYTELSSNELVLFVL